jgi:hypothetical protein
MAKKKNVSKEDDLKQVGKDTMEAITELVSAGDTDAILEDAHSVQVRSDWHEIGENSNNPTEYLILIAWGGPAARIIGKLSEHLEPETAVLEVQDWGTPWTEYRTSAEEDEVLMKYAQAFYYGEK